MVGYSESVYWAASAHKNRDALPDPAQTRHPASQLMLIPADGDIIEIHRRNASQLIPHRPADKIDFHACSVCSRIIWA
jgi:hypothetical protein